MAAPVLTTPVPPRRQTRATFESRAERVEFGDGYVQTSTPLNAVRRTLRLSWRLRPAEADALMSRWLVTPFGLTRNTTFEETAAASTMA